MSIGFGVADSRSRGVGIGEKNGGCVSYGIRRGVGLAVGDGVGSSGGGCLGTGISGAVG